MTESIFLDRWGGDHETGAAATPPDSIQQRIATPEELAAPVCFLLSDDASFMTGSLVVADGGQTAI
jgi:NAD(P)-dependent dehydrogenase (short-subunit alcohol dehydrogenase family)